MGILSGILGNASEVDLQAIENELAHIIVAGEDVQKAFRVLRDMFIFTDKRLILVDKQGLTGHKTEYHSIPYKSVSQFSFESAGHLDLDSELKIWVKGVSSPILRSFKHDSNILELQKTLAFYVLKS